MGRPLWRHWFRRPATPPAYRGRARQVGFIVGTGRCGTTVLAQVLNSHSRIVVPDELQFFVGIGNGDRIYEKAEKNQLRRFRARDFIALVERRCPHALEKFFDYRAHFAELSYPQADPARVLQDLIDHLCDTYDSDVFLEQTPWYGQRLDVLSELFPDSKVIHLVRDGRDVAVSYARSPWWSNEVAANLERWADEVMRIHRFVTTHPQRCIEMRYEDLVADARKGVGGILDFLGLPFEDRVLDPREMIDYDVYNKLEEQPVESRSLRQWNRSQGEVFFTGSSQSWRRDPHPAFGNLSEKVRTTLVHFGYETL